MPQKRLAAEQVVTKLRQIEVLQGQGRSMTVACGSPPSVLLIEHLAWYKISSGCYPHQRIHSKTILRKD